MLTLPFVLYGIFRYLYLIHHKNEGGDPTQSLLSDIPMLDQSLPLGADRRRHCILAVTFRRLIKNLIRKV